MFRSLATLFVALLAALLLTAIPRITPLAPPDPFTATDYAAMVIVLLGALAAGRSWYYFELYLTYGLFGTLIFVPAYVFSDSAQARYRGDVPGVEPLEAILRDAALGTIAAVTASLTCMFLGRWANRHVAGR